MGEGGKDMSSETGNEVKLGEFTGLFGPFTARDPKQTEVRAEAGAWTVSRSACSNAPVTEQGSFTRAFAEYSAWHSPAPAPDVRGGESAAPGPFTEAFFHHPDRGSAQPLERPAEPAPLAAPNTGPAPDAFWSWQQSNLSATSYGRREDPNPARPTNPQPVSEYSQIIPAVPVNRQQSTPPAPAVQPVAVAEPRGISTRALTLILAGTVLWLHVEALVAFLLMRH